MIRKHTIYSLIGVGWAALVMGTFVALYTGNAEFIAPVSELPRPLWKAGGVAVAITIAGWLVVEYFKSRAWRAMGRRLNLQPDSGGLAPSTTPDLRGTLHGRPVRVSTFTKTTGSGESRSSTTYTIVEANLDQHVENGILLGRDDGSGLDMGDYEGLSVEKVNLVDGFVAIGATEGITEELVTPRVRNAFAGPGDVGLVTVGNAIDAMMDAIPETGMVFGWLAERAKSSQAGGDSSTVSIKTKGVILDPDEIQQQLDAVAAVADAYEDATA